MNIQTNVRTTPLRRRMIEDMRGRNLGRHSQRSHLHSCERFAAFLERSPETASADDVRQFQLFLIESGLSIPNRNRIMTGVKFLLRVTLKAHEFIRRFLVHVLPRGQHRIRHYGFFGNGNRAANITRIRNLLGADAPIQNGKDIANADEEPRVLALPCPACAGRMIIIESFPPECQPRAPPNRRTAA